uniref:Uncharacterized protein n=1 Tax=Candidatus Kentrum sp. LPFa TaxID=2126335 RepID=A0A450W7A4_9GAMM|nr:MAG: hypothetical protein BECKLPF1236B_GA0070989_104118 [Candidatus Kentron sp. LPFa]
MKRGESGYGTTATPLSLVFARQDPPTPNSRFLTRPSRDQKVAESVCGWGPAERAPSHPYSRFLDRFVENFPDNGLKKSGSSEKFVGNFLVSLALYSSVRIGMTRVVLSVIFV